MLDTSLGPNGYLSVIDYPLLVFYGCMCAVYVVMGLVWLVLCSMHWRDLLRIQFWIGGVIFLGMLEKAMFLVILSNCVRKLCLAFSKTEIPPQAEFSNINATGDFTPGLIFAAEIVSCAKRTLARMLVIIVSLGFGIVKPRLGQTMHRVVFVGALYFFVASAEAYLRIVKPKNDISGALMTAAIPLSIIDRYFIEKHSIEIVTDIIFPFQFHLLVGLFCARGHDQDPPVEAKRGETRPLSALCQHPRPLGHRLCRLHDVEHQISQARGVSEGFVFILSSFPGSIALSSRLYCRLARPVDR